MSSTAPLQDNLIVDKTFQFAVYIVNFSQQLQELKHFVISNQILKSGTSIGANVRESQNGESLSDFIHKFKIAAKEADETEYWLLICKEAIQNIDQLHLENLLKEIKIIQKILTKIIASSKNRSVDRQITK
jgi:four helix bundle protein